MPEKSPLTPEGAQTKALQLWAQRFTVSTSHFRQRCKERNVSIPDIEYLLEKGKIQKPPEFDEERANWMYVIEGKDCDGVPLAMVFAIDETADELILVTVKGT